MFDWIIENGTIIDGRGTPGKAGKQEALGIKGAYCYRLSREEAGWAQTKQRLDAKGLHVLPGFVDMHRHGDLVPFLPRMAGEEIKQGITTFVNGNCGFSLAPSIKPNCQLLAEYGKPIFGTIPSGLMPLTIKDLLERAEAGCLPSNMAYMVGGGALRIGVKGFEAGTMTGEQLDKVCRLLRQAFAQGAIGLSMGLMYAPEHFYLESELIAIAKVAAAWKRPVTVHMRGEGSALVSSVEQIIRLAKASQAAFHISHLKAAGKRNWHTATEQVLELIDNARQQGVDLSFDVYPYCAGSTALYTLLPPQLLQGGIAGMTERLMDLSVRRQLVRQLRQEQPWDNLVASTGWHSVVIAGGAQKDLVGKTVAEIAADRDMEPELCMIELLLENRGDVPIVFHSMSPQDMERILSHPASIIISDAIYSETGNPHPRRFGSFAKAICEYGDKLGLEQVVEKMTNLPARRMGIKNRGQIRDGYFADLVLLDVKQFKDRATYEQPCRYQRGLSAVFLNGELALDRDFSVMGAFGRLIKP